MPKGNGDTLRPWGRGWVCFPVRNTVNAERQWRLRKPLSIDTIIKPVRNTVNAERQWRRPAIQTPHRRCLRQEHGECRKAMETWEEIRTSAAVALVRNTVNAERQWRPGIQSYSTISSCTSQEHGECRKAMETQRRKFLLYH